MATSHERVVVPSEVEWSLFGLRDVGYWEINASTTTSCFYKNLGLEQVP